jgi:hypothetical protein
MRFEDMKVNYDSLVKQKTNVERMEHQVNNVIDTKTAQ